MPKFRYRVVWQDSHRSGVLEARDESVARAQLASVGWRVEALDLAPPESPAGPLPLPQSAPRPAEPRPEPAIPQPVRAPLPLGWVVATLAMLLGFVMTLFQGHRPVDRTLSEGTEPAEVRVKLSGRLRIAGSSNIPHDARVTVHLPQIPLDETLRGPQLALSSEGEFEVELTFASTNAPTFAGLTAELPGFKAVHLASIPLQGGEASFPPVVFSPR